MATLALILYGVYLVLTFGLRMLIQLRRTGSSGFHGLAGLVAALELQVRVVEEPYLLGAHGATYFAYGARVGRFFPGIGRLRRAD